MIDLVLEYVAEGRPESLLERALRAHIAAVEASAGAGDRRQVARVEAAVRADPATAFRFDGSGVALLDAAGGHYRAGRFETPSLGVLRERAMAAGQGSRRGRARLSVLLGASPATDIGSLQAGAGRGTLFQVASQFNCLESPGPYISRVADYFGDPTQGPRASLSAFPGALLRHYAAPGGDGGRFVQTEGGRQVDLLEAVCSPETARARCGYLTPSGIVDPEAFAVALEEGFDEIRIGVHEDVEVVLGYDWDGGVQGERRIAQVLTSTLAGGWYGGNDPRRFERRPICVALLRAAYLGTLLAAGSLGRNKVVLTLVGGGVFGNPARWIWESLLWALDESQSALPLELDVVLNGRNLGDHVPADEVLQAVRARGGAVVRFDSDQVAIAR